METFAFIALFLLAMFISVVMVIQVTVIRKLREAVNELKEQNHKLRCSEYSLLWQRQNLRNEIKRLVLENGYWGSLKDLMHNEVLEDVRSAEYKNMTGANRIERLYQKAFDKHYKW